MNLTASEIAGGAIPGDPKGPIDARGCDKCKFGVISSPDLWGTGVPLYLARAMALDVDGLCYTVYCSCKAGKGALTYDMATREKLNDMTGKVTVVAGTDSRGHYGLQWGSEMPDNYVPGYWWGQVREACRQAHFSGE